MYVDKNKGTLLVISGRHKGMIKQDYDKNIILVPVNKLNNADNLCRELKCRTYTAFYVEAELNEKQQKSLVKVIQQEITPKMTACQQVK